jgi:hypothetical protein
MKHIRAVNKKARRIDEIVSSLKADAVSDVVALQQQQQQRPHIPMGCTLSFSPGWEVDSAGGTAGLCQPVERDIYDCYPNPWGHHDSQRSRICVPKALEFSLVFSAGRRECVPTCRRLSTRL